MFESPEGLIEINATTRLSHFETGDIIIVQLEQPGQSLHRNRSIEDVFQEGKAAHSGQPTQRCVSA